MFICVCMFVFVPKNVFVCFNMSVRISVCVLCACLGVLVLIIENVYVCLG